MLKKSAWVSFVALFAVSLGTCSAWAQNPNSKGIWISNEDIARLPTSGKAWDNLKSVANGSAGTPDLSDQDDPTNVRVMAKALVYARTGDESYRQEVIDLCMRAIETENGGRTLALARELIAYVIAADLVGLPPDKDAQFKAWLDGVRRESLSGKTLISTHEDRPNNWGTHAGGSRVAVAVYLSDQQEIERCAQVFKGWLGDRGAYSGFHYGSLDWQADSGKPVGINAVGTTKSGHNIGGVLPDDQRRAGGFKWPPPKENYVYEALQGVLAQAVILHRQGYDVWNWSDRAILRTFQWLHQEANFEASGDDSWEPHLANFYYGSNFPAKVPSSPGKNVGWTDWTHGSGTGGSGITGIEGQVRNAANDNAVSGATVLLRVNGSVRFETTSSGSGRYSFSNIQAGSYELFCTRSGFSDFLTNVSVPDGQTLFGQNIILIPTGDSEAPAPPQNVAAVPSE